MPKLKFFSPKKQNLLKKANLIFIFILFIINLESFNCQETESDYEECDYFPSIFDTHCFNDILIFNNKKYQAGNFATNKNGDIILQFSEEDELSSSRLFYGLTKDGKNFFLNQTSSTKEINVNIDEIREQYGLINPYRIYHSLNLFVPIKDDPNKGNQYLFSINSYSSLVELYDLNNENNTNYIWNFNDFFNLDEDIYFFPYDFSLFESSKESAYFLVIIPKVDVYVDMLNSSFIKKFRFKSFGNEAYEEISSTSYNDYLYNRIINAFYMEDYRTLVILTYGEIEDNSQDYEYEDIRLSRRLRNNYEFTFKFYNYNLKPLSYANDMKLDIELNYINYQGEELFFKSIYLGNQYVIFAYIIYYYDSFIVLFEFLQINYFSETKRISTIEWGESLLYNFVFDESLSDFIKIDNRRLAFIYNSGIVENSNGGETIPRLRNLNIQNNDKLLIILIIDIIQSSNYLTIRPYVFNINNLVPKMGLSSYMYNGYLLFTTNTILEKDNSNFEDSEDYFSIFMAFSYGNGTDDTIEIIRLN